MYAVAQRDFSLENAPWKEEKRVRGKILDETEAEEALLDEYLRGAQEASSEAAPGGERSSRSTGGGVYMGPEGEGWQKFVIEGGLDLGDLEDEEMSSLEVSGESGDAGEGEDVAMAEDGVYMGPKGEGWETFKIEGGLDVGLGDLDEDLEPSEEWERRKNGEGASKWTGATAFEFEARQKDSRLQRQVASGRSARG